MYESTIVATFRNVCDLIIAVYLCI